MKILHISTSDTSGGAAIAAMRLHKAMLAEGIDSTFLCLNRSINDDDRIVTVDKFTKVKSRTVDLFKLLLFSKLYVSSHMGLFSNMKQGYKPGKFVNLKDYDVIYLHWINGGFLSFKGVEEVCKTGKKIFWFMHDMFPITGGCHHSFNCSLYTCNCGNGGCQYMKCLKSSRSIAYKQLKLKHKVLDNYQNLSFVAPSKWLYECARNSSLGQKHEIYCIPNMLDETVFHQVDKSFCREVLNLPQNKKFILFGADSALNNPYKGFSYLESALKVLKKKHQCSDLELIVFGSSENTEIKERLAFPCHFFGYLHDMYSLNLLYNAADVFCMPSLAEAFGQTALESIFCGTPVVAFNVGGVPDFVSEKTGYLAKYKDADDFAKGIELRIQNSNIDNKITIERYKSKNIVKEHFLMWK